MQMRLDTLLAVVVVFVIVVVLCTAVYEVNHPFVGCLYMADGDQHICLRTTRPTSGWSGVAGTRLAETGGRLRLRGQWVWSPTPLAEFEE